MRSLKYSLIFMLMPLFSFAWNGIGHSTGGAIAYYYLKSHYPQVISKVINILKGHPWYNDPKHWAGKLSGLSGEEKNVMLFMLASTFPDDARGIPSMGGGEKSKWHYIDYPFVPAGSNGTGHAPEDPNALGKLNELLVSVTTEADPGQKAQDLCWIFHLIEDLHQPLHTASMFDNNHPDGDRGGNSTYIIFRNAKNAIKLHSYWDGLIKGSLTTVPENAQRLLSEPMYQDAQLTELRTHTTVSDWVMKESFPLAKTEAYGNGKINDTSDAPTEIDDSYGNAASKTAERRVVLAGVRIAQKLVQIL